jgi:hypothetical protein
MVPLLFRFNYFWEMHFVNFSKKHPSVHKDLSGPIPNLQGPCDGQLANEMFQLFFLCLQILQNLGSGLYKRLFFLESDIWTIFRGKHLYSIKSCLVYKFCTINWLCTVYLTFQRWGPLGQISGNNVIVEIVLGRCNKCYKVFLERFVI